MNHFELLSFPGPDQLAQAAAAAWLDEIQFAHQAGQHHCVALSGGRITQKFFAQVVAQNQTRHIPFAHVHFFWADERCVPPTDAESNFKLASELLFAPLKISAENIHRLRGEIPPTEAVKIANEEVLRVASMNEKKLPVLDLILLGMGEDGHVASLFPNATPQIFSCPTPFLSVHNSPKPPPDRISMSYATIIAATKVWALVSGAGKEIAFRDAISPSGRTPLAKIVQLRDNTKIFSDIS